jgi:glycosyl hydrolase family 12
MEVRWKLAVAIVVAIVAGFGGGAAYALIQGPSTPSIEDASGQIQDCAANKQPVDGASGHQRKCQNGMAQSQSAGPGSPSSSKKRPSPSPSSSRAHKRPSPSPSHTSSSPPPPVAAGSYSCNYQTDTWSGDASSVGYSVQKISSNDGKTASFSVKLNANHGTTEVVGYPSDQCLIYSALPSSLSSSYRVTPPGNSSGLDYEFAYDIWLTSASAARSNNWDNDLELMIWTYNHGQRPAGSRVTSLSNGSAVWFDGNKGSNNSTVSVVLRSNSSSGTIDITGIIAQLKSRGYIPSSDDGILDVEYGIEAPYGGGNTFSVNSFSVGG